MSPIHAAIDDSHHNGVARSRDTARGEFLPRLRQTHNSWCPLKFIVRVVRDRLTEYDIGMVVLNDTHISIHGNAVHFIFSWLFAV